MEDRTPLMDAVFLLIYLEREVSLHHPIAIDGFEMVSHRNDMVTSFAPLFTQ